MGDAVHIHVLGASITIQTDQNPHYIQSLVDYIQTKATEVKGMTGKTDHLKTSILAALLIADELFEERRTGSNRETGDEGAESLTQRIIEKIDTALEGRESDR